MAIVGQVARKEQYVENSIMKHDSNRSFCDRFRFCHPTWYRRMLVQTASEALGVSNGVSHIPFAGSVVR